MDGSALRDLSARYGGKVLSARVYPEFFELCESDNVVNLGCGDTAQVLAYGGSLHRMVGIDVSMPRLLRARTMHNQEDSRGQRHVVCALGESIPLRSALFDKALAIDVIEHVLDPKGVCEELYRVLKPRGRLLMTFPALHDRYADAASALGRLLPWRRKGGSAFRPTSEGWHPDAHNHSRPLREWIRLVEDGRFVLRSARASTLFPPLHLYGVPRFWFSSDPIHAVDRALCSVPGLRRLGQALICDFERR